MPRMSSLEMFTMRPKRCAFMAGMHALAHWMAVTTLRPLTSMDVVEAEVTSRSISSASQGLARRWCATLFSSPLNSWRGIPVA